MSPSRTRISLALTVDTSILLVNSGRTGLRPINVDNTVVSNAFLIFGYTSKETECCSCTMLNFASV